MTHKTPAELLPQITGTGISRVDLGAVQSADLGYLSVWPVTLLLDDGSAHTGRLVITEARHQTPKQWSYDGFGPQIDFNSEYTLFLERWVKALQEQSDILLARGVRDNARAAWNATRGQALLVDLVTYTQAGLQFSDIQFTVIDGVGKRQVALINSDLVYDGSGELLIQRISDTVEVRLLRQTRDFIIGEGVDVERLPAAVRDLGALEAALRSEFGRVGVGYRG